MADSAASIANDPDEQAASAKREAYAQKQKAAVNDPAPTPGPGPQPAGTEPRPTKEITEEHAPEPPTPENGKSPTDPLEAILAKKPVTAKPDIVTSGGWSTDAVPPGQAFIRSEIDRGTDPDTVFKAAHDKMLDMIHNGMPIKDAQAFWGIHDEPQPSPMLKELVQQNVDAMSDEKKLGLHPIHGLGWSFMAGWGMSATGMMQIKPFLQLDQQADFWDKASYAVGNFLGDAPEFAVGMVAGTAATENPGAGMFVGGAVPAMIRTGMMDYYRAKADPGASSASFINQAGQVGWEGVKAGTASVIGYKTAGLAGKYAADFVGSAVGSTAGKVAGFGAEQAGFAAGSTAADAALNRQLPDAKDFMINLPIMVLGGLAGHLVGPKGQERMELTTAGRQLAENSMFIYAKTGLSPKEQSILAERDPAFRSMLNGPRLANGDMNPELAGYSKGEPPPAVPPEKPTINAQTEEKASQPPAAVKPIDEVKKEAETPTATGEPKPIEKLPPTPAQAVPVNTVDLFYQLEHWGLGRHLGDGKGEATSPAGASGGMQVMPDTARLYGFDPSKLGDPVYDEHVFRTIYADLAQRTVKMPDGTVQPYTLEDVAVAYNAGPGTADAWIRAGRHLDHLNPETQHYVQHLEQYLGVNYGHTEATLDSVARQTNPYHDDMPPARGPRTLQEGITKVRMPSATVAPPRAAIWTRREEAMKDVNSATILPNGELGPAPHVVADYMQEFGRLAGFKFLEGPAQTEPFNANQPLFDAVVMRNMRTGEDIPGIGHIYMPATPDEQMRAWYGLGRAEVLYHEAGHAIDYKLNGPLTGTKSIPPGPLRDEIIAASKSFRPKLWEKQPDYNMRPQELMADAFAKWLSDPTIRQHMPEFTKKYGDKLVPYLAAAEKALPTKKGSTWEPPPPGGPTEPTGDNTLVPATGAAGGGGKGGGTEPPQLAGPAGEDWSKTPEAAQQRILDMIADKKTSGWLSKLNPSKLFASFYGELQPARKLDKAISPKEKITEDTLRSVYGAKSLASSFYLNGTYAFDKEGAQALGTVHKTGDDSMMKAFAQVKEDGGNMEGFLTTWLAASTVVLAERGIKRGVSVEDAWTWLESDNAKPYARAMATRRRNDEAHIDLLRDSGMINDKTAYSLKNDNMFHVIWRKMIDTEYQAPTVGSGFLPRNMLKKIGDSEAQIVNPMTAEIDNKITMVAMAKRNVAWQRITAAIEAHNGIAKANGYKQIGIEKKKTYIDEKGVYHGELLDTNGDPIPEDQRTDGEKNQMMIAETLKRRGPNDFPVWTDGKMQMWTVKDPELAKLVNITGLEEKDPLPQIITKIASLDRAGITGTVAFGVRALWHHQIAAATMAEGGAAPFHDLIKGVMMIKNKTFGEMYDKAMANGAISTIVDQDSGSMVDHVNKLFDKTDTWGQVANAAQHPVGTLGAALETIRAATHKMVALTETGFYARQLEAGKTPLRAAALTRKSGLDYAEKFQGAFVNYWAQAVPFMSTGLKDMEQFALAHKDRLLPTALRASAYVLTPTIVAYAANYIMDQEKKEGFRYVDRPLWERDAYWLIPTDTHGGFFRVKKPYVIGYAYSTFPEHLMSHFRSDDPMRFHQIMEGIADQVMPPSIPTVLVPPIEVATNRRLRGLQDLMPGMPVQPLVPGSLERGSPGLQYKPDTTEAAKAFSRAVKTLGLGTVSPIGVDTFINDMLGTIPLTALKMLDQPFKPAGTPKQLADNPFVGSFFARTPGSQQMVSEFYDRATQANQARADLQNAVKLRDPQAIAAARQNPMLVKVMGMEKAVASTTALINAVNASKMDNAEKVKNTDALTTRLVQISTQYVRVLDMMAKRR